MIFRTKKSKYIGNLHLSHIVVKIGKTGVLIISGNLKHSTVFYIMELRELSMIKIQDREKM